MYWRFLCLPLLLNHYQAQAQSEDLQHLTEWSPSTLTPQLHFCCLHSNCTSVTHSPNPACNPSQKTGILNKKSQICFPLSSTFSPDKSKCDSSTTASFVTPNLSEVLRPAQLLLEGQLFKRPIPAKGISLSLIIAIIVITIVIIS